MESEFQNLFKIHQFDIDMKQTDIYINLKRKEYMYKNKLMTSQRGSTETKDTVALKIINLDSQMENKKIPFDMIFMQYIFANNTNQEVRKKALEVLIKNFN